jgi:hypothetical protein
MRVPAIISMTAAIGLALGACTAGNPTPIVIHVTPTPTAASSGTPIVISVVTPTPTVQPTDTPLTSPTPIVTPAPTAAPTAAPTGPADGCSGLQANKDWWAAESKHLVFTVYCGSMPSGWYFESANDNYNNGGMMYASYNGPSGATFSVFEGKFDPTIHGPSLGSANFGDLGGTLYSAAPAAFALLVNPGTTHAYQAVGSGSITQATFVNLAARMVQVPKS